MHSTESGRLPSDFVGADELSVDHQALGRAPDRVAREQRDRAPGVLVDDPHVEGCHDLAAGHDVGEGAMRVAQHDLVARYQLADAPERATVRRAMCRYNDVAPAARLRGPGPMRGSAVDHGEPDAFEQRPVESTGAGSEGDDAGSRRCRHEHEPDRRSQPGPQAPHTSGFGTKRAILEAEIGEAVSPRPGVLRSWGQEVVGGRKRAGMEIYDDAVARAAAFAAVAFEDAPSGAIEARLADAVSDDPDPRARAAALGALVRVGTANRALDAWGRAVGDAEPAVRRRAAEVAPMLASHSRPAPLVTPLVQLLADDDVTVVDAAAWALGELGEAAIAGGALHRLADVAIGHDDPLAREAAVAALGALGDEAGLPAILAGCRDKATIRRRAVLALAPFEGDEVEAALAGARADRDWQVRQAAEDLTRDESTRP